MGSTWLDATYVKVREAGRIIAVVVAIAVGVNGESRRELLSIVVGTSETEIFCADFLRGLLGLALRGVKLAIFDAYEGLKAAVGEVLPATQQRCRPCGCGEDAVGGIGEDLGRALGFGARSAG